jgi:hypothetical protein
MVAFMVEAATTTELRVSCLTLDIMFADFHPAEDDGFLRAINILFTSSESSEICCRVLN